MNRTARAERTMSSKAPMPGMSGYAVAAELRREPTLGLVTLNGGGGNRTRVRFRRSARSRIAGSVCALCA